MVAWPAGRPRGALHMARNNGASDPSLEPEDSDLEDFDSQEYDELMQLERLESLEEEMMELGVTSLDEIRQRIGDLHRDLDEKGR
jgi:hypothetical protein